MLAWSFFGILYVLLYLLCLYFVYVFITKKDPPFLSKFILGLLFLPVIGLSFTRYNLSIFDVINCEAVEERGYLNYYYILGFVIFIFTVLFLFVKYFKSKDHDSKKQIQLLSVGMGLFLLFFFLTTYIASLIDNFELEQYGLFGVTFFMGVLAYMIVKFKAFNIKLIGAQALVIALITLIGSQFFFIQNNTNRILTGITLALALVFGYLLIRSVKKEVEQREALEIANKEINERKEQLQKLSDSLTVANDKLKRMDATKTDFINIASHQLKKVPTPIKGYLSLLLEGSYGEISKEQRRVLENVNSANDRQINLVDDLLNVARMESGRVELDFQKQRMENICQEVYTTLLPNAKEKNLELGYEKPEKDLPELIIDKGKIFEAIFNFVDNAIKYTPKGKVDLKVELASQSNYKPLIADDGQKGAISGSVVRVTVSDTGMGISKESIPYLFAKFSRKDTSHLNTNGTGLGLYVVKLMVEAHGGRTWAESDGEGKGSRFIIEIPTKQPEEVSVKN